MKKGRPSKLCGAERIRSFVLYFRHNNGVRYEFLSWIGEGEHLLFLSAVACSKRETISSLLINLWSRRNASSSKILLRTLDAYRRVGRFATSQFPFTL